MAARRGLGFGACCRSETWLAQLIVKALPSVDRVRFVCSGTEAVMSALRVARAATGRAKILKFTGCYHGHTDAMLVAAGSGAATLGTPDSAGLTAGAAGDTIVAPYNDLAAVDRAVDEHGAALAAIIVEPVAGNMGLVRPADGFLEGLRAACDECGALLIFDEVMTGFRVAWGGWQVRAGLTPDLSCLGKVIGGGLPVAAYAGRAELMDLVAPSGPVYQAGTLAGNPLGMAAGIATINLCREPGFYERLESSATRLVDGLREVAADRGITLQTGAVGGMAGLFFSDRPVRCYDDAKASDDLRFRAFFHGMLGRGVWLPPSPYEAMFVSAAHTDEHIDLVIDAARLTFTELTG